MNQKHNSEEDQKLGSNPTNVWLVVAGLIMIGLLIAIPARKSLISIDEQKLMGELASLHEDIKAELLPCLKAIIVCEKKTEACEVNQLESTCYNSKVEHLENKLVEYTAIIQNSNLQEVFPDLIAEPAAAFVQRAERLEALKQKTTQ